MKTKEAIEKINPIADIAENDGDVLYVAFGSKEENAFSGFSRGIDFGDALLIIQGLVNEFGIDPVQFINSIKPPPRLTPPDQLIALVIKLEGANEK
jgi:hypothetical protein